MSSQLFYLRIDNPKYPNLSVGTHLKQVESLGVDSASGSEWFAVTDGIREYYMDYSTYLRKAFNPV